MSASNWSVRLGATFTVLGWQVLLLALLGDLRHGGSRAYPDTAAHGALPPPSATTITDVALWRPSHSESSQTGSPESSIHSLPGPRLNTVKLEVPDLATIPTLEVSAKMTTAESAVPGIIPMRCEVHIHQRGDGQVQAIDFGVCTGDAVWQEQLLGNLQRAAALVTLHSDTSLPPVRTLRLDTSSVSPEVLAEQLSESSPAIRPTPER